MKTIVLSTFVAGIEALMTSTKQSKKVDLKIVTEIDSKNLTIYSDTIAANDLQIDNFGAFRSEVNDLTRYHKGLDIQGLPCVLTIGEHSFKFAGGKFSNNLNILCNSLVIRGGLLGHKKELKKEAKAKLMEKLLPIGCNLLQFIEVSAYLDKYTNSEIQQGASAIDFKQIGQSEKTLEVGKTEKITDVTKTTTVKKSETV